MNNARAASEGNILNLRAISDIENVSKIKRMAPVAKKGVLNCRPKIMKHWTARILISHY